MKVAWSQTALNELDAIHARISETSVEYANRIVDRLTRRAAQMEQFPRSGRAVPEFGLPQLRELIEGPYRLIYRIGPDGVEILAVLHGARSL